MKTKPKIYRQGDVLLQLVDSLPKTPLTNVAREGGKLVLAHGTATGHSHAVPTAKCALFRNPEDAGELFLEVTAKEAELVHDEHTTIALAKGIYRVTRQREFSASVIRRVED